MATRKPKQEGTENSNKKCGRNPSERSIPAYFKALAADRETLMDGALKASYDDVQTIHDVLSDVLAQGRRDKMLAIARQLKALNLGPEELAGKLNELVE